MDDCFEEEERRIRPEAVRPACSRIQLRLRISEEDYMLLSRYGREHQIMPETVLLTGMYLLGIKKTAAENPENE